MLPLRHRQGQTQKPSRLWPMNRWDRYLFVFLGRNRDSPGASFSRRCVVGRIGEATLTNREGGGPGGGEKKEKKKRRAAFVVCG